MVVDMDPVIHLSVDKKGKKTKRHPDKKRNKKRANKTKKTKKDKKVIQKNTKKLTTNKTKRQGAQRAPMPSAGARTRGP